MMSHFGCTGMGLALALACWLTAPPLAAQSIARGAGQSLPELLREMGPDSGPTERLRAAEAVAGYGSQAVPPLLALMEHPDARVRGGARLALSRMGPLAAPAVPLLIKGLTEPNRPMRSDVVLTLGRIGPAAAEAVPALLDCLSDPNADLRAKVVQALGRIGAAAVPGLGEQLQTGSPEIQLAICTALAQIGSGARAVLPALVTVCEDADPPLRDAAFMAMMNMGADAVDSLVELLRHQRPELRRLAAMTLGQIGSPAAAATAPLCRALGSDPEPEVRFWAASALGEIGAKDLSSRRPPDALQAPTERSPAVDLVRACHDPDPDVRWQAAVSLEALVGSVLAQPALRELSQDPHPAVRRWAVGRVLPSGGDGRGS